MLCKFLQCLEITPLFVYFTFKIFHSLLSYPPGPTPSDFALLKNLQILKLDYNYQLTGVIPKFLGSLSFLTQLWLGGNQFIGKTNTFLLHVQLKFGDFVISFIHHDLTHFVDMYGDISLVMAILKHYRCSYQSYVSLAMI